MLQPPVKLNIDPIDPLLAIFITNEARKAYDWSFNNQSQEKLRSDR